MSWTQPPPMPVVLVRHSKRLIVIGDHTYLDVPRIWVWITASPTREMRAFRLSRRWFRGVKELKDMVAEGSWPSSWRSIAVCTGVASSCALVAWNVSEMKWNDECNLGFSKLTTSPSWGMSMWSSAFPQRLTKVNDTDSRLHCRKNKNATLDMQNVFQDVLSLIRRFTRGTSCRFRYRGHWFRSAAERTFASNRARESHITFICVVAI